MFSFQTITLLLFLVVSSFSQTKVEQCRGVQIPKVSLVAKDTVCTDPPCYVFPGYSANIHMNFTSPFYVEKLLPNLTAVALGAVVPWPSDQKDGCEGISNTVCPIVKNEPINYLYTMDLLSIFPEIPVKLIFSITNAEDGQVVTCFTVDLQVKRV